ncbi:PREDICTED: cas scaffolding protein family member 4 [Dipodomys ordii]|uniref:Cas scaffolding protein family member 4 n=1 Tax=Dipodomys ordii TaxID=10020 RepID=A0A1S3FUT4_DIPOR|nr:PREDICTED: cas scaffolding protein family member 4 [Dipodomys ordii]
MLLARALYDNRPDCCDELAFSKGDILMVLEQNVPESQGWWKCLLHGRQGLAPANRLLVLPEAPPDRPCPLFLRGLENDLAGSEGTYEVPTPRPPLRPGPVYEPMKSWMEGPPPPTTQVYVLPEPPSQARAICEKTLSFSEQALFVFPRPTRAWLPTQPSQVYDMPAQSRVHSTLKEPEKQPLYDVPASPQKAALHPPASHASEPGIILTAAAAVGSSSCHTLPNPQKPAWTYDIPSPRSASVTSPSLPSPQAEMEPRAGPASFSPVPNPPNSLARSVPPQPGDNMLRQKKSSLPDVSPHPGAAPRDSLRSEAGVSYKVPSSFLVPRVEQQNTTPNIYAIPKALSGVLQPGSEWGKAKQAPETPPGHDSSWFSQPTTSLSHEPHRLSISSSDSSRASVMSSCSSMSADSSSSSSSELALDLDPDTAKETVMALQHQVVGSAAGLLLFVNRKWRFRDSLETHVHAIRQAAGHVEESLRQFLDFAQGVRGSACHLTDHHLQARIQDQLQTISNSYQALLEAKGSLDSYKWSLDILGTDQVPNSSDDLERFVMVARIVPEDVKKFASIVIANARLLFTQNSQKEELVQLIPNAGPQHETCTQSPFPKEKESELSTELGKKSGMDTSGQGPSSLVPQPLSQQTLEKKIRLSEHCRLYFGALLKAVRVFASSLHSSPAPEVFISQSKLVITAGQKLVDTLCAETREKDAHHEILCRSSYLCGLLRDLALATKSAVLQHPSPAALEHLRAEAQRLEHHVQQFRGTLD